jgi:hypothetical protein
MTGTHLVLAFGGFSWGEASFGVRIARELHHRGHKVAFVAHSALRRLLVGLECPVELVSSDSDLRRLVETAVEPRCDLASIVLADASIATEVLEAAGIEPARLLASPAPVVAVDTWDAAATGHIIDSGFDRTRRAAGAMDGAALRILPAPFLPPEGRATRCRALPSRIDVAPDDRRRLRASLGLDEGARVILVCTALWQMERDAADAAVPALVSAYVAQLGDAVHVVHVGPAASALGRFLGARYHWQPSLTRSRFDLLMGSADLLLSLNLSASTIAKAIASRLPIVVLQNAVEAATREDAAATVGRAESGPVAQWLADAAPIPRFRVWPLGYFDYLAPIVDGNPYQETFVTCELFDPHDFIETCHHLLFDAGSRDALRHRQDAYHRRLQSLPTPAEAIAAFVDSRSATSPPIDTPAD